MSAPPPSTERDQRNAKRWREDMAAKPCRYCSGRGWVVGGDEVRSCWCVKEEDGVGPCIFLGCVSTDRHWHGGFPGGYDNPADPEGPPILFTSEPSPGVRDYNGALLPTDLTTDNSALRGRRDALRHEAGE